MSLVSPRLITMLSRSVRRWKISNPRNSISGSGFSTKASLNNGNKFLKPLYDSQFEADGTPLIRVKPKPTNSLPIRKSLAEQLRSQGYTVEESLPPLKRLDEVKKAGILDIRGGKGLDIVRRFIQLAGTKEGLWEAEFCAGKR
jgi:hypothetical protein